MPKSRWGLMGLFGSLLPLALAHLRQKEGIDQRPPGIPIPSHFLRMEDITTVDTLTVSVPANLVFLGANLVFMVCWLWLWISRHAGAVGRWVSASGSELGHGPQDNSLPCQDPTAQGSPIAEDVIRDRRWP